MQSALYPYCLADISCGSRVIALVRHDVVVGMNLFLGQGFQVRLLFLNKNLKGFFLCRSMYLHAIVLETPLPDFLVGLPDISHLMGGRKLLPYYGDLPFHFTLMLSPCNLCRVYDKAVMLPAFGIRPVENRIISVGPEYS